MPVRLHGLGILFAGELLAVRHPHHIRENLQAVAVRVEEVEGATATAAQVSSPFEAVDKWPVDQLDPMSVQMCQGFEERIPVLDLKGDLLDQPLARAGGRHIHARGGGADHEVVVHVVKAQEGRLRSIRAPVTVGDLAPKHFGVEAEGTLEVGDQKPYVSDALNVDTHMALPPRLSLSICTKGYPLQG